jgi:glutaredoxin 3
MLKATVWTRNDCLYCSLAKKELHNRKYQIDERNITSLWSKEDLLKVVPNAKTVPQIFIRGKYIGGYDELMTYFEETTSNYGH